MLANDLLWWVRNDLTVCHAAEVSQAGFINRLRKEVYRAVGIHELNAACVHAGSVVPTCPCGRSALTLYFQTFNPVAGNVVLKRPTGSIPLDTQPIGPTRSHAVDQVQRMFAHGQRGRRFHR